MKSKSTHAWGRDTARERYAGGGKIPGHLISYSRRLALENAKPSLRELAVRSKTEDLTKGPHVQSFTPNSELEKPIKKSEKPAKQSEPKNFGDDDGWMQGQ